MVEISKPIAFFFVFLVILGLGVVVIQQNAGVATQIENNRTSQVLLTDNVATLNFAPNIIHSITASNITYLGFDGTRSYVNVSTYPTLDIYQGAFTVSFWLNATNYSNNVLPRIMEKRSAFVAIMGDPTNARYSQMAMELTNITGSNTYEAWSKANVTLNAWEHWVFVYNGSNGTWYKNGAEVSALVLNISGTWTGDEQNSSGFDYLIGRRRTDLSRNLNGNLDEIRLFNTNLSAGEVSLIFAAGRFHVDVPHPNQVWFVSFNENQGTTTYDSSGLGNNGTISDAIYRTDGINIALINNDDYSTSGTTFTVLDSTWDWSQINMDYSFLLSELRSSATVTRLTNLLIALLFVGLLAGFIIYRIKEFT